MSEKTLGQINYEGGSTFLASEYLEDATPWENELPGVKGMWEAGAAAVCARALEEVEHYLSSEIKGITLGPALEGKLTEQEALALVNASRQCLLAGIRSLRSPEPTT